MELVKSEQIIDKNTISDLTTKVENLEVENSNLKKANQKLEDSLQGRVTVQKSHANRINDLEQYSRRNSIRIYGVDDRNPTETPYQTALKVADTLSSKLGLNIDFLDIDIAHRMGKFMKDGNRPIICKFVTRFKKYEVIKSRRLLKGTSVVIKEDLTQRNIQRIQEALEVENVTKAWSDDGKIIALLDSNDTVQITYKTDLSKPIKAPKKKKTLASNETARDSVEITENVSAAGSGVDDEAETLPV